MCIRDRDKGTRDTSKTKIISTRDMDWKVANTFSPWYCTYWAARISPEFFPYIEPNTQQRTWWWNAIDRCDNAAATWYKIWSTPSNWALIVYKQWGSISVFGHVGKMCIRDRYIEQQTVHFNFLQEQQ